MKDVEGCYIPEFPNRNMGFYVVILSLLESTE